MIHKWLAQYEGRELELFRNYGNPYETISIRVQVDKGCLYLGDEEYEHGPDGGHSIAIYTFDRENTRKVFAFLSEGDRDPMLVLKNMLNEKDRTGIFIAACDQMDFQYVRKLYL